MKTSSVLMILFLMNSGILAGIVGTQFIGLLNPYIIGGVEVLLGISYYVHTVIRDVRNCFDVDIEL
ncbi:hypothetical protein LVD13_08955 [Flavobacteriaceae bacterium D16]|nr:hypothetical protein [Flavobacteriaceae bacterium D16]